MTDRQSYFAAIWARDVKIAFRSGGGWFYAIFFFTIFVALSAIAIGPEMPPLTEAAPAVTWLATAFAIQFAATDLLRVILEIKACERSHLSRKAFGLTGWPKFFFWQRSQRSRLRLPRPSCWQCWGYHSIWRFNRLLFCWPDYRR